MIKSYSSLQTKCYKFSRQQDTEEIELVAKVSFDQGKWPMKRIFQRAGGEGGAGGDAGDDDEDWG